MSKALIIVDIQNDFCEGGSLAVEGGAQIADDINAFIDKNREEYSVIVATRDYHIDPGAHFSDNPDFIKSWPVHCKKDTPGASFHPRLDVSNINEVFSKGQYDDAYSGFEGVDNNGVSLAEWLRKENISEVDVVGLALDYCVAETALDAVEEGFETQVVKDLTKGINSARIEKMKEKMMSSGVKVS